MEKTIYVELSCIITGEEIVRISGELAGMLKEYQVLHEEKRLALKAYNDRIGKAERDFMKLADVVNSRKVTRAVRCRDVYELNKSTVMRIRTDTGEVVSKRAMEPEERQMELDSELEQTPKDELHQVVESSLEEQEKEHERVSADS